jgi:hypothetical protein
MSARTSDISRVLRNNQSMVADAKVVYAKLGMGLGLSFPWLTRETGERCKHGLLTWASRAEIVPSRPVAKNDVSFVVGGLMIALMRRGGLSTAEGNAWPEAGKSTMECPEFFSHGRRSESDTMLFAN